MININDEVSVLKTVILGVVCDVDEVLSKEDFYDPKSLEHFLNETYPKVKDMQKEMASFEAVLKKHKVNVLRPENKQGINQIFVRDTGFVIDNTFVKSNILPKRDKEFSAILPLVQEFKFEKLINPPKSVHIEGGDVILYRNYIFIGTYTKENYADLITARTNIEAVKFLKQQFPDKIVKSFSLIKSNNNPKKNVLHLDCCFQPVGKDKVIIYKNGFINEKDYDFIVELFGKDNIFEVTNNEMYELQTNVFSISPKVVISDKKFSRLNKWLKANGFYVEEISYSEISKLSGLFRCSTLPLLRN